MCTDMVTRKYCHVGAAPKGTRRRVSSSFPVIQITFVSSSESDLAAAEVFAPSRHAAIQTTFVAICYCCSDGFQKVWGERAKTKAALHRAFLLKAGEAATG
jgi:hypothetical protein